MAGPPLYPDTRTGLNRPVVPLPRTHTMSKVPLTHLKKKLQNGFVSKDPLRWLTTVLMEYKSTIFNSFEKGSKLFFPSLFNACLSLLPFYVKFEQLNVNKWPK